MESGYKWNTSGTMAVNLVIFKINWIQFQTQLIWGHYYRQWKSSFRSSIGLVCPQKLILRWKFCQYQHSLATHHYTSSTAFWKIMFPLFGSIFCNLKYKDYFKNTLVHKQMSYREVFKMVNFSLRVPFEPSPTLYLQHQCICGNLGWTSTVASENPCFLWCAFLRDRLCLLADWTEQLYIKLTILITVENGLHFSFLHFVITIWDWRGFYLKQNIRKCPHLWFIWSTFYACLRQKDYLYMDIFQGLKKQML